MRRQMLRAFSVHKARAIVDIEVGPGMPWQLEIDAGRKRVALIVIQKEIAFVRWFEISQAAGDSARAFGVLVGIDGVELCRPAMRGEFAVASHPRMRARSMVSGKKILELPRMS